MLELSQLISILGQLRRVDDEYSFDLLNCGN